MYQHREVLFKEPIAMTTYGDRLTIGYKEFDMPDNFMTIKGDDIILNLESPLEVRNVGVLEQIIEAILYEGVKIGPALVCEAAATGYLIIDINGDLFKTEFGKGEHQFSKIVDNVIEDNFTRKIVAG